MKKIILILFILASCGVFTSCYFGLQTPLVIRKNLGCGFVRKTIGRKNGIVRLDT